MRKLSVCVLSVRVLDLMVRLYWVLVHWSVGMSLVVVRADHLHWVWNVVRLWNDNRVMVDIMLLMMGQFLHKEGRLMDLWGLMKGTSPVWLGILVLTWMEVKSQIWVVLSVYWRVSMHWGMAMNWYVTMGVVFVLSLLRVCLFCLSSLVFIGVWLSFLDVVVGMCMSMWWDVVVLFHWLDWLDFDLVVVRWLVDMMVSATVVKGWHCLEVWVGPVLDWLSQVLELVSHV